MEVNSFVIYVLLRIMVCFFEMLIILVSNAFFSNLDMNGRRLDHDARPELKFGTVDYIASKVCFHDNFLFEEYCARTPVALSYIFAIDVSFNAIQSGMLLSAIEGIKYLLFGGTKSIHEMSKIAIMTFDRSVHFYNLKVCSLMYG